MVSSRKQDNVDRAVQSLRCEPEDLTVEEVVCHVGNEEHRRRLIQEVSEYEVVCQNEFNFLNHINFQSVSKFGFIASHSVTQLASQDVPYVACRLCRSLEVLIS